MAACPDTGTYMYVLNSSDSTNAVDMQTTAFGCLGIINGVWTVCCYITDLPIGYYVKFPMRTGIHIQTNPNAAPNGSWPMASGWWTVTVNKSDGTITLKETSAESVAGAEAVDAAGAEEVRTGSG